MEQTQKVTTKPNPRKGANIFSLSTFAYTFTTFRTGFRKEFQEEDVPEHLEVHASKKLGDRLEEAWKKELHLQHPSLWRAIRKVFWAEFAVLGFCLLFIEFVIKLSQPIALAQLIRYYTDNDNKIAPTKAYMYSGVIVGASFLNVIVGQNYVLALQHLGMKLRIACCSIIYRKSLKLSRSVLGGTTIGQMVNLLSNDVKRCDNAVINVHHLWVVPLQTVAIICLLNHFSGLTSTIGVFFMVLFIPFQMYLGKMTSVNRLKTALKTDERVRLMNEIISGIQVIKMYTWEKPFAKLVAKARKLEIRYVRATSYIKGLLLSLTIFTSSFALFLAILIYVLLGNTPDAEYVFVVTAFYNILKQTMTKQLPRGITEVAEINVSISRIQKFLLYAEVDSAKDIKTPCLKYSSTLDTNSVAVANGISQFMQTKKQIGIQLQNVSAKWTLSSSENTLDEINFAVQFGQLVAVISPVGSGKTSLLHVILKELPLKTGSLNVEGKISYASQEPWVFASTVQQNILFGQPMNRERYHEVIRVCSLEQDLILLPHGDQTLVGERGVTLSGGQRARVSLARAIYREADIYLLDDPLSAVDTHVGKRLFEDCIIMFLKNKCVILVTHQLQYLQNVDHIYLVEKGNISASGSYHELRESGKNFAKQLLQNKDQEEEEEKDVFDGVKAKGPNISGNSTKTDKEQTEIKEQRSTGKVVGDIYMSYLTAGGSFVIGLIILFLFVLTQGLLNLTDYFLTYWVNMEQAKSERVNMEQAKSEQSDVTMTSKHNFLNVSRDTYLYIYSILTALTFVLTIFRSLSFFKYCMRASIKLHNNMFSNIVHAPMLFFNTNSSGRILNRFSKDIGSIDESLPMVAMDVIHCGLTIIGVTIMVSLVNPWLFIVTVIITTIFALLRIGYMRTSRSVKRLEGITRSPVFTHISASLQGLTTIRAFGAQGSLQKQFDDYQDFHSSVYYVFLTCSRAFAFWLDVICVGYIGIVTFSFFLGDEDEYGGSVGLAITQAMKLTGTFQWSMRQWTELENQMTSVERVIEYTKLEHEENPNEKVPPVCWPEEGSIDFALVSLRYSPTNPYVLKQLNFNIKSKEKVGIVGRTGAGKSSIIFALFQLAKTEGAILIDSIDIAKVPLESLRSKISIIPQEPVLFSGTLRKNLDPFDEYSDEDLWKALEEVELKKVVIDLPAGLSEKVSEGGSNFSVGQRQLVCLARAIVRKNKILVLDEATANVDPQTDVLIQTTIRRKFAECTVLTIAHRLHTVMDSDKVLVMDQGKAIEFDHPYLLLKNEQGLFYGLVQQTGNATAENLMKTANENYEKNNLRFPSEKIF